MSKSAAVVREFYIDISWGKRGGGAWSGGVQILTYMIQKVVKLHTGVG
jgi:hypothetical protein